MAPGQYFLVGLCLALPTIEGFDIFVMAFTASAVAADWGLTDAQIGLLLSGTPIGMALGSLLLAPLADRFGRRPLILWCLVLCSAGMVLATVSTGYEVLLAARVITGLGTGGIVAGVPVLLAEYTPVRRRGTTIAIYSCGFPLGGALGGVTSAFLITEYGWRAPFLAGSVATILFVGVVYGLMPESITFLLAKRPRNALAMVNKLLVQIRQPELPELPPQPTAGVAGTVGVAVLGRGTLAKTGFIWIAYFCALGTYYFANSWTPRLLETSGASAAQSASSGILLNVGGIVASLLFAVLALRMSIRFLTVFALLAAAGSLLMMSLVLGNFGGVLVLVIVLGLCINASLAGTVAVIPDLYPPLVRSTAVGWATGVGRIGAIVAPLLVGVLLDRAWTPENLLVLFAVPAAVGGLAVFLVASRRFTTKASPPSAGEPASGHATEAQGGEAARPAR